MSHFQSYCECRHATHDEGGAGHPFSIKFSEDDMVPVGWERGHQVQFCRGCVQAGHAEKVQR